ncbi:MAG TPA: Asd/ArgC dimerization domain-containing protein [Terriglobales bacterium]|nr:Asd/ArgC dimerization domain-containing protein [Terriglobales bacterium]
MKPQFQRVAIVGAATLKGKELKEVLEEREFPALDVRLLDDDESLGQLESVGDEATFIQSVTRETLEHVDVAFFACEENFTRRHWHIARDAGCAIVDLSYALEEESGVSVRSAWLEQELAETRPVNGSAIMVVAHPAAVVLGMLLVRARRAGLEGPAIVTAFEPASEHGRRGIDELHEQTVNLLSFQGMPRDVFDSQVAFNLVSRYGEQSLPALETVERRILSHFEKITRGSVPVPSMVLLQAPIFHGHCFSVYLGLDREVPIADVAQALEGEHVAVTALDEDAPTNVSASGQEQILVSVRSDAARRNGVWLWVAADNLRVLALNAAECAARLAPALRGGRVQ